jgi:hypothetical protein
MSAMCVLTHTPLHTHRFTVLNEKEKKTSRSKFYTKLNFFFMFSFFSRSRITRTLQFVHSLFNFHSFIIFLEHFQFHAFLIAFLHTHTHTHIFACSVLKTNIRERKTNLLQQKKTIFKDELA